MNENGRPRPSAVGREVNSAFEEEGEEASPTGPRVGECRAAERILTLYLHLRSGKVGIAWLCPSRLVRTFA